MQQAIDALIGPVSEAAETNGEFWQQGVPALRVRGQFRDGLGTKLEATLEGGLMADPRISVSSNPDGRITGYAVLASPARSVEAFQPITLHGRLDTGEMVTLLDAQNHGGAGFSPRYVTQAAIFGAQVLADQLYNAVRFRADHPYWLGRLNDGQSAAVEDDGSILSVETLDDVNWLRYESTVPATLRQFEIRVLSGCLALAQLALYPDEDLVISETHVRVGSEGPWLEVRGPAFCGEPNWPDAETLLPRDEITIERFAKWIALNNTLDGLPWIVGRPRSNTLQMRILALAPLVEGLHRRLPDYEQGKFPGVEKRTMRRILIAARDAARNQADVEGLDPQSIQSAVTVFQEVSYRDRAEAIVAEVCSAIPEIAESVADLPRRITTARNELAHQLLLDEDDEQLAVRVLRWLVVANVTAWLLRGLLLLRAGIDPEVLRGRFLSHRRFQFFRANTAQHVSELGWESPSWQQPPRMEDDDDYLPG